MVKKQTICLAVFSHVAVETPHQPLYQINSTTNHRCILGLMASRREQNPEREITHQHVPVSHSRLSGSSPARTVGHMLQPNPLPTTQRKEHPTAAAAGTDKHLCGSTRSWARGKYLEFIYYTLEQWLSKNLVGPKVLSLLASVLTSEKEISLLGFNSGNHLHQG